MTTLRGFTFVFLWYTSIIWSVYFLYCPLVPIVFFSRKWFRKCTDIVLAAWEIYPAALLEIFIGCRVCLSGDAIDPSEGSIIIMNHRNRLDWFFLWAALLHGNKPPAHRCKFVLKSGVKGIPGIGWGLQLAGFLYIHRTWEKDQRLLERSLDYFKDLGNLYQILIFPEGTDLSESTKAKSNAYALKQGMPEYEYVLHPRTTGFAYLVSKMKQNSQISAVYDMTIGYPKTLPHSETDILHGKIPEEVHFQIKRHDLSTLPDGELELKAWCEDRWAEKEKALNTFYSLPDGEKEFSPNPRNEMPWNAMYFVLWGMTAWTLFTMYLTFTNWIVFCWVLGWTITFIIVSRYTDGLQQVEISLHHFLNKNNNNTQEWSIGEGANMKTNLLTSTTTTVENNRRPPNSNRACAIHGSGDHKLD